MALTEEQRAYQREWKRKFRAEHPTAAAEYRKSHLDAMRLAQRKSKRKHAERCKEVRAAYKAKYPRRVWVQNSRTHHQRQGFPINIALEVLYAYAESADKCAYCGEELDWTPFKGTSNPRSPTFDRINNGTISDHIWGGEGDFSDGGIAIVCTSCNSKKQEATLKEWLESCECKFFWRGE